MDLDPITVEVVRNKLDGIANEMELTLLRSSYSPIVKEGMDASASLFTIDGQTLAQATAIPIHLATLIPMVRTIIDAYPVETMEEGDLFILNDPYLGGTHLPDIAIVKPVIANGRPVALSATMTHHQDVGGMTPGSVPTTATEIFQEGIRIPALRLCHRGTFDETLLKILRQNVRIPDTFMGDLNAQIAGCTIGARRVAKLAETYGVDQAMEIFKDLLNRSELMTRAALRDIPEGTYRYSDVLDNDGIELDRRVPIEVAITIKDGTLHCDFTGCSAQVRGPINSVPSGAYAAAYFLVRALTGSAIPNNGGCFRPVTLNLPEGSIVNPNEPAPVNARSATIKRVIGCMIAAFRDVLPDRIPADASGSLLTVMFGGRRSNGKAFVVGELIAGGSGASSRGDGVDCIETDGSNCMNLPAEAMEMEYPIRVHRVALRQNSGGNGRFRGGLGLIKEYELLEGEVTFTHRGERHFSSPQGAHGGQSAAPARTVVNRASGEQEVIPSKCVTTLRKGDRVVMETPGGGGYEDPRRRDPLNVSDDVRNGKITLRIAKAIYDCELSTPAYVPEPA